MSSKSLATFTLLALALSAVCLQQIAGASPATSRDQDQEPLSAHESDAFFPMVTECKGEHEQLKPGSLPTCEPTCSNPRPGCPKIFYTSLDFVPCFCARPYVRNEQTKECVKLEECPKNSS